MKEIFSVRVNQWPYQKAPTVGGMAHYGVTVPDMPILSVERKDDSHTLGNTFLNWNLTVEATIDKKHIFYGNFASGRMAVSVVE